MGSAWFFGCSRPDLHDTRTTTKNREEKSNNTARVARVGIICYSRPIIRSTSHNGKWLNSECSAHLGYIRTTDINCLEWQKRQARRLMDGAKNVRWLVAISQDAQFSFGGRPTFKFSTCSMRNASPWNTARDEDVSIEWIALYSISSLVDTDKLIR